MFFLFFFGYYSLIKTNFNCREMDDNLIIMRCEHQMAINLLQYGRSIPYKYFIYSNDSSDGTSSESGHGWENIERWLIIPTYYKSEGMFNKFYLIIPIKHFSS